MNPLILYYTTLLISSSESPGPSRRSTTMNTANSTPPQISDGVVASVHLRRRRPGQRTGNRNRRHATTMTSSHHFRLSGGGRLRRDLWSLVASARRRSSIARCSSLMLPTDSQLRAVQYRQVYSSSAVRTAIAADTPEIHTRYRLTEFAITMIEQTFA